MKALLARAKRAFAAKRERWGWLDHLIVAAQRYKADDGNTRAAAVTYYTFLSVLPLLLLAISALGFVLSGDPSRQADIVRGISARVPGIAQLVAGTLSTVQENRNTTGLVGVLGLLYSGLGGIDALRVSVRDIWHQSRDDLPMVRKKIWDVVTLAGLGAMLALSFGLAALGGGLASWLLDAAGIGGPVAKLSLSALSIVVTIATDTAIFLFLFTRLARCGVGWPSLLPGALLGGFGLAVLKVLGSFYVGRTTANSTALYGAVGAVVGVLVGLNLLSRFVLYTAAWTVTLPAVQRSMAQPAASPDEPYPAEPAEPVAPAQRRVPGPLALARSAPRLHDHPDSGEGGRPSG